MTESSSLAELFSASSRYYSILISPDDNHYSGNSNTSTEATINPVNLTNPRAFDEKLSEAIEFAELAIARVREQALFSKGEDIDEHPTEASGY